MKNSVIKSFSINKKSHLMTSRTVPLGGWSVLGALKPAVPNPGLEYNPLQQKGVLDESKISPHFTFSFISCGVYLGSGDSGSPGRPRQS